MSLVREFEGRHPSNVKGSALYNPAQGAAFGNLGKADISLIESEFIVRVTALLFCITVIVASNSLAQIDDEHLGLTEYELACMPCHGIDGHGDGPLAKRQTIPPSDLTQIAKSNGGRFPKLRITKFIDGRAAVAAHGAREMPVWGDRYRRVSLPDETPHDADRRVRAQIDALVRYVEMLQH